MAATLYWGNRGVPYIQAGSPLAWSAKWSMDLLLFLSVPSRASITVLNFPYGYSCYSIAIFDGFENVHPEHQLAEYRMLAV